MNKKREEQIKIYKKYTMISILIFFVTSSLLTVLYFEFKKNEIVNAQSNVIYKVKVEILKQFSAYISDVNSITDDFIKSKLRLESNDEIALEWKEVIKNSETIDHIRFVDNDGNEVIRVNNTGTTQYITPENELQNKSERYYYEQAKDIDGSNITFSDIDLNIENGKIKTDENGMYKPVVRGISPVYNKDERVGFIIVNYNLIDILEKIKDIGTDDGIKTYILNHENYIMNDEDHKNNFNWLYEERKDKDVFSYFTFTEDFFHKKTDSMQFKEGYFVRMRIAYMDFGEGRNVQFVDSNNYNELLTFYPVDSKYGHYLNWSFYNGFKHTLPLQFILLLAMVGLFKYLTKKEIKQINDIESFKENTEIDKLTGFYLRSSTLKKYIEAINTKKHGVSLAFLDLNNLKEVNDNLGHEMGDILISDFAKVVKSEISEREKVVRWGGDEFIIFSFDSSVAKLENMLCKVTEQLEKLNNSNKYMFNISVSYGIADSSSLKSDYSYNGSGLDSEMYLKELIKVADESMYEMKTEIKTNNFSVLKSKCIDSCVSTHLSIGKIVKPNDDCLKNVNIVKLDCDIYVVYLKRHCNCNEMNSIVVDNKEINIEIIETVEVAEYKILILQKINC